MKKLLKSIRFDGSDLQVFPLAAEPNEWVIPCAFQFCDMQWEDMEGKTRQAFNNGFLGLGSFGYSTFGCVARITEKAFEEAEMVLAKHIFEKYGAPSLADALEAARTELAYAVDLCAEVPENTVFAVSREFTMDGRIKEAFHKVDVEDKGELHAKIWTVVEDD